MTVFTVVRNDGQESGVRGLGQTLIGIQVRGRDGVSSSGVTRREWRRWVR